MSKITTEDPYTYLQRYFHIEALKMSLEERIENVQQYYKIPEVNRKRKQMKISKHSWDLPELFKEVQKLR